MMRFLRRLMAVGSLVIVVLLAPSVLLKMCGLPVPRLCAMLAAAAMLLIPVEVAAIGSFFCAQMVMLFKKGRRERSLGQMLTGGLMFSFGCVLTGYVLRLAVRAMWVVH